MNQPKKILLKLTGELFLDQQKQLSSKVLRDIAHQIKQLGDGYQWGIVVGAGNFFRGSKQGVQLGLHPSVGHTVGMLATLMNGLITKDIFEQEGIPCALFSAVPAPEVGTPLSQQAIDTALSRSRCLIFSGGTGNPFFTTDTTAIVRALQINAAEVWKGTGIDGVYDKDPRSYADASKLSRVTYAQALEKKLGIMDQTAFALAATHELTLRVFDIFMPNALLKAAADQQFGSIIQ